MENVMRVLCYVLLPTVYLVAGTDVSSKVELLGNPYSKKYKNGEYVYARNIWDMQIFEGKLFLGAGNSNNFKPAKNAGKIPVFSFDAKRNIFHNEYTIAEEQLDRFRVIGDKLYIPGHDATQKWDFGNFYTRSAKGEWKKYRTIPDALHVYDIVEYSDQLFVALGLNKMSGVGVSQSHGLSWAIQKLGPSHSRVYSFLKVSNALYACKSFTPKWKRDKYWSKRRRKNYYSIGEYDGLFFMPRFDLQPKVMFPDTYLDYDKTKKIIHSEFIGDKSIYIGAYVLNNGHQSIPFGVYIARSLKKSQSDIQKVRLPDGYIPWDIIVRDDNVYILCYDEINCKVSVVSSNKDNLYKWKELFSFKSIAFARSFELLNEDFYFGIGSEIWDAKSWNQSELMDETGDILRVKKESYRH